MPMSEPTLPGTGAPEEPQVTRFGMLDMQVCVPTAWTDEQVRTFAETKYPCGTSLGWQIRRQGSEALAGSNERVKCAQRSGYVHIMLDA